MVAATAVIQPPLTWGRRPGACEVDELASEFLRQESATAAAYATAISLDEQLEVMRERLILAVEEFAVNGNHELVGATYELVLTVPTVTILDPDAVQCFHVALLTQEIALFSKVFTPHVHWTLAPGAHDVVARLKSKNARTMFARCLIKRADPPILQVRSRRTR